MSRATEADNDALIRLRNAQRKQPRVRGSFRRSRYLLDMVLGTLERGTRPASRGPYPQHMIDNNAKMRARTGKP